MTTDSAGTTVLDWRGELPTLTARLVTLREPTPLDVRALVDLLSMGDASRFGVDEPVTEQAVQQLVDRAWRDRAAGLAFAYVVTISSTREVAGLVHVRRLDPSFESGEWECLLAPAWRGTGVFLETARLVGSFAFGSVGAHRLESRVLVQNGRANGALSKIGAVQEGILRRSVRQGGVYLDQVLWSVLKEDWGDHWVATGPRVH